MQGLKDSLLTLLFLFFFLDFLFFLLTFPFCLSDDNSPSVVWFLFTFRGRLLVFLVLLRFLGRLLTLETALLLVPRRVLLLL